eukprot:scaffold2858_cov659-Pavlova_lutheri.AAC.154
MVSERGFRPRFSGVGSGQGGLSGEEGVHVIEKYLLGIVGDWPWGTWERSTGLARVAGGRGHPCGHCLSNPDPRRQVGTRSSAVTGGGYNHAQGQHE